MNMTGNVLSQGEMDSVHRQSIKILEEVGVQFPDEGVLSMLNFSD